MNRFLKVCWTLALIPMLVHAENKADTGFYVFVNHTNGKFTDAQIGWGWTAQGPFTPLTQSSTAPARNGNGRVYVQMSAGGETYTDFIEYAQQGTSWSGNTTLVDEFVIPLTIELFSADGKSREVGIAESRKAIFAAFRKDAPKEFQSCIKGTQAIVSPCRADFDTGKPYGTYFDKYIGEVWEKYSKETKTPGGWTAKREGDALTFSHGDKTYTCATKPTSRDAFLGTGPLGQAPHFCSAINRHVLAEPENWNDPIKFYQAEPNNFYAKFWHQHCIGGKAYGFCYDDWAQQDTLINFPNATKLVITLNWD